MILFFSDFLCLIHMPSSLRIKDVDLNILHLYSDILIILRVSTCVVNQKVHPIGKTIMRYVHELNVYIEVLIKSRKCVCA